MIHTRYFSSVNLKAVLLNLILHDSMFWSRKILCINSQVDGTDDKAEYNDTMDAMTTMGMDDDEKSDLIQVVTGKIIYPIQQSET